MTYQTKKQTQEKSFKPTIWHSNGTDKFGWVCRLPITNSQETYYDKPLRTVTVRVWRPYPHSEMCGAEIIKAYGDDNTVFEPPITTWSVTLISLCIQLKQYGVTCSQYDFEM